MKILQVSLGKQEDIRDALHTLGDVIYWDWSGRDKTFNQDILNLVEQHQPNLIWLQIQTPGILRADVADRIAQKAVVVNWTGDVRHPLPHWFMEIGQFIHLTLFTNMEDVNTMRKYSLPADYLQIGFPTKIFKPEGPASSQAAEIVFLGNNVGGFPLSKYRVDMVDALVKRYGSRFKAYGINNGHGFGSVNDQHEEAAVYRGCKIGINISHYNYSRYSSDRLFRLMGAGAFCLSHNYTDIQEEFIKGEHLDTWDTIEELCNKIDYYLEHEEERKKIAKAGCAHVHKNHTWNNRVKQLSKMMFK